MRPVTATLPSRRRNGQFRAPSTSSGQLIHRQGGDVGRRAAGRIGEPGAEQIAVVLGNRREGQRGGRGPTDIVIDHAAIEAHRPDDRRRRRAGRRRRKDGLLSYSDRQVRWVLGDGWGDRAGWV